MAAAGPRSSHDEEELEGGGAIFAEINITPLTDIFLVLLIIFMVTTTAIAEQGGQQGGIRVDLPKAGRAQAGKELHDLAVAILEDGRTVMGGELVDEEELKRRLAAARAVSPDTLVLVQADRGVPHGRVVAVMDLARQQGLARLAIATRADAAP